MFTSIFFTVFTCTINFCVKRASRIAEYATYTSINQPFIPPVLSSFLSPFLFSVDVIFEASGVRGFQEENFHRCI